MSAKRKGTEPESGEPAGAPPPAFRQVEQRYAEAVPVENLKPDPENPNEGAGHVIAESILANGFYGAVLAVEGEPGSDSGTIVAGAHRWTEACDAGADTLPVLWLNITKEEARRILLVDNRSNRRGRDDSQKLVDLLSQCDQLAGTGFDDGDLEFLLEDLKTPAGGEKGKAGEGGGGDGGPDPTASWIQVGPHKWSLPRVVFDPWLADVLEAAGGTAGVQREVFRRLGLDWQPGPGS